jgi:hypothetical protein
VENKMVVYRLLKYSGKEVIKILDACVKVKGEL